MANVWLSTTLTSTPAFLRAMSASITGCDDSRYIVMCTDFFAPEMAAMIPAALSLGSTMIVTLVVVPGGPAASTPLLASSGALPSASATGGESLSPEHAEPSAQSATSEQAIKVRTTPQHTGESTGYRKTK